MHLSICWASADFLYYASSFTTTNVLYIGKDQLTSWTWQRQCKLQKPIWGTAEGTLSSKTAVSFTYPIGWQETLYSKPQTITSQKQKLGLSLFTQERKWQTRSTSKHGIGKCIITRVDGSIVKRKWPAFSQFRTENWNSLHILIWSCSHC